MHGYKIKQRTEPAFCFFLRNKKTETNTLPTPLRFDVVRLHGYIHPEYLRRTQTKQPAGYIVSLKISPETHLLSLLGLSQTHQKLLVRFDGTREQSTAPTIISDSPRQSGVGGRPMKNYASCIIGGLTWQDAYCPVVRA